MPTEEDLGPGLNGRLTYLLKRALIGLIGLHEEGLGSLGIDHRELSVLLVLDAREPESQQQVAGRLGVDRTTMVALIDGLEDKGLVARRPDPADRRRNVIALTAAGRKLLRPATRASDAAEARLLADLDDDEAAALRALLARVARPAQEG